jgi:ketosteroid isomerase-like protein
MHAPRGAWVMAWSFCVAAPVVVGAQARLSEPPTTRRDDVREMLHGVEIVDSYRWLEDGQSTETRAWIDAQNTYAHGLLDAMPGLQPIRDRLTALSRSTGQSANGASVAGSSPAPPAVAPAAADVEMLERRLVTAIGRRDLAAYDRLVADDYVVVRATGDQTKAQVVEGYRKGDLEYHNLEIHDVAVRVHGDTAVLTATTSGSRVENGRESPNRVRYLRVWVRRDGAWRAVTQMAVPLPPPE